MIKDTLFISHATPDDNEFAVWLATKLELLGYKTWVDAQCLNYGSDFWHSIEDVVRNQAIRFLFVASHTSSDTKRHGVQKELALAEKVKNTIENFIIPIRLDDIGFSNLPMEVLRLNTVDFNGNWGGGLHKLVAELEKQGIPKAKGDFDSESCIQRWNALKTSKEKQILDRKETYSSNIFCVKPPSFLYCYQHYESIEEAFRLKHIPYIRIRNFIISFICPNCIQKMGVESDYNVQIPMEIFEQERCYTIDKFGCHGDIYVNNLTNLIAKSIECFLYQKGLRKYRNAPSGSRKVMYFKRGTTAVPLGNKRKIQLSGSYYGKIWHYGISMSFLHFPESALALKAHLIFTNVSGVELPDSQQITARRAKGKRMFNRQWRNWIMAAMNYLSDGTEWIYISSCCEENPMYIRQRSIEFESPVGYIEGKMEDAEDEI